MMLPTETTLPVATSLSAKRCLVQEQLRLQREEIVARFFTPTHEESHFPRSVTMRLLSGRTGLKLITGLFARKLLMRHPSALANVLTLVGLFKSK